MPIIHFIQSLEDRPQPKETKKDENNDDDDILDILILDKKQASK